MTVAYYQDKHITIYGGDVLGVLGEMCAMAADRLTKDAPLFHRGGENVPAETVPDVPGMEPDRQGLLL